MHTIIYWLIATATVEIGPAINQDFYMYQNL